MTSQRQLPWCSVQDPIPKNDNSSVQTRGDGGGIYINLLLIAQHFGRGCLLLYLTYQGDYWGAIGLESLFCRLRFFDIFPLELQVKVQFALCILIDVMDVALTLQSQRLKHVCLL